MIKKKIKKKKTNMKTVKTYEDFVKNAESPAEVKEAKSCISEKLAEALKECYEAAKNEMKAYHESENKEEIAEKWCNEYNKMVEECNEGLLKECEAIMAPTQDVKAGQA
jgi:uncharacterized protein (DUF111 family)